MERKTYIDERQSWFRPMKYGSKMRIKLVKMFQEEQMENSSVTEQRYYPSPTHVRPPVEPIWIT